MITVPSVVINTHGFWGVPQTLGVSTVHSAFAAARLHPRCSRHTAPIGEFGRLHHCTIEQLGGSGCNVASDSVPFEHEALPVTVPWTQANRIAAEIAAQNTPITFTIHQSFLHDNPSCYPELARHDQANNHRPIALSGISLIAGQIRTSKVGIA